MDLVFNVTRAGLLQPDSTLASLLAQYGIPWRQSDQVRLPPNALRLRIAPGTTLWPSQEVQIRSTGERLEFVKYVFRRRDLKPLRVFAPDPAGPGLPLKEYSEAEIDANEAIGKTTTPKDYLIDFGKEVSDKKNADPDWVPYWEFFYKFDLYTNTKLWPAGPPDVADWDPEVFADLKTDTYAVSSAITNILGHLEDRMVDRVTKGTKTFPKLDKVKDQYTYDDAWLLHRLQKKLYQVKFGGLSVSEQEKAFELFAQGKLRLQLDSLAIAAQPSSGFHFFFGEFALLALDNAWAPSQWKSRARFLLRSQPTFAWSYGPRAGPTGNENLFSYDASNFTAPIAAPAVEVDPTAYANLEDADLEQKALDNAKKYLGGLAPPP